MTGTRHRVVHARVAVSGGCDELRPRSVEGDIKDFVVVATERVDAGAALHVPDLNTEQFAERNQ